MTILDRLRQGAENLRANVSTTKREPRYYEGVFYVRARHFVTPSVDDAFELALILNTYPMTSWGVERPTEPCISKNQYDRLPETLKGFFSAKTMRLKIL